MDSDDQNFLGALEAASIPNAAFRHADHLRAVFLYLTRDGYPGGADAVAAAIKRFAAAHGASGKYHETLTRTWARLVAAHMRSRSPGVAAFGPFIEANPELLDKALPAHFYSQERLFSPAARERLQEPDLHALPAVSPWPS